MYLAVCVLKKYRADGRNLKEEKFVRYILDDLLSNIDHAFSGIFQNLFANRFLKIITAPFSILFKLNPFSFGAKDVDERYIVNQYCQSGSLKDKLTAGIYLPEGKDEVLGRLENTLSLYEKTVKSRDMIKIAIKNKRLPKKPIKLLLDDALRYNIISQYEFDALKESEEALYDSILVDDYKFDA